MRSVTVQPRRWPAIAIAVCAVLLALGAGSSTALAARTELAPLTGFSQLNAVDIDPSDNVWLLDNGAGALYEYDAYPSTTKLTEQTGGALSGCLMYDVAIAEPSGSRYVTCGEGLKIFDSSGAFQSEWTGFKGLFSGTFRVAIDNSESPGAGRAYVVTANHLEAFEQNHSKALFAGKADYIYENEIIGVPVPNNQTGAEHQIWEESYELLMDVAVDNQGNVYVPDRYQGETYEFTANGEYVRTFKTGQYGENEPQGVAIDPTSGNVLISGGNSLFEFNSAGQKLATYPGLGGTLDVNSEGFVYIAAGNVVYILSPEPKITYEPFTEPTTTSGTLNATVDPKGASISECFFEWGPTTGPYANKVACEPGSLPYGGPTQVHTNIAGLTPETPYHYRVSITTPAGVTVGGDRVYTPHRVIGLRVEPASDVTGVSATLNASFVGNGEDTHYFFEWGTSNAYGNVSALPPGTDAGPPGGPAATFVSFPLSGLNPVVTYHYRVVASNANTSYSEDGTFTTTKWQPLVRRYVSDVHSESAVLGADIDPGGVDTSYRFEYGVAPCSELPDPCASMPTVDIGKNPTFQSVSRHIEGLAPGTVYHYRVVAENGLGTTIDEGTFSTFPFRAEFKDSCPNSLARQQTGAALTLDCRAYEIVSARDAGGYDVESDLVPGQTPFGGYPQAEDPPRVLYGVHDGAIPGVDGHPTNRGVDPYVASRGQDGWSTTYVGMSADNPFSLAPFSSLPTGADVGLSTFAFGGADGCSPCFAGGYTGIPVHLSDGGIVQGMAGSLDPGPSAERDGYVAQTLSADGSHLVFGSTAQFEPDGNDNGDVSIYSRNLETGQTRVVSRTPGGANLPCLQGAGKCNSAQGDADGIAALGVSANGDGIDVAQKVATDGVGNVYWHLYLSVAGSANTIDLTPSTAEGALYDGMTQDGSTVFFTTKDQLDSDGDESADLYRAELSGSSVDISRISTGKEGAGQTDSCDPVHNANGSHWNAIGASANCDVVAIAGAGGVAASDGTIYFLSPERLDGAANGIANQPNLYVVRPGSEPHFVATLSPEDAVVVNSLKEAGTRKTADFQVTRSGRYAVFTSALPLTGFNSSGFSEVFRLDSLGGELDCASCNPSNGLATGSANLAPNGSNVTETGQVFFDSPDPLTLRDSNNRADVYEWEPQGTGTCVPDSPTFAIATGDCVGLVSSGLSPFDSRILSTDESGTDVYFFTHDALAPQDLNGPVAKVYDARSEGGFFVIPDPALCAASDECHGPGSQAPGSPSIRTVAGAPGNLSSTRCRAKFVRRHGKCVKKKKRNKRSSRNKRDVKHG
jgi:hypothetical protein